MPTAEIGSFFPRPDADSLTSAEGQPGSAWPPNEWALYNSGRAALRAIVERHQLTHPNAALWMPSYYCWDVNRYASNVIPVRTYPCRPTEHRLPADLDADDLLLVESYFGAEPPAHSVPSEQVILDTTHDPTAEWLGQYSAGWVFGSLRKTLPLPEGGYAYAPGEEAGQLDIPGPTEASREAALRGAEAMAHKSQWIAGDTSIEKSVWYADLQQHEAAFENLGPAPLQPETLALLRSLPVRRWRDARLHNLEHLLGAIDGNLAELALHSTFGLALLLPSGKAADAIRLALIQEGIYAAKIWPQPDGGSIQDIDVAKRLLLFHTDFRYGKADMERVALALMQAFNEGQSRA